MRQREPATPMNDHSPSTATTPTQLGMAGELDLSPRLTHVAPQDRENARASGAKDRESTRTAPGPDAGILRSGSDGLQPDNSRWAPLDYSREASDGR